jgi:hypothetical protein
VRRVPRLWVTRSIGAVTVKLGPVAVTVWRVPSLSVTWATWTGHRKHTLWPLWG